jgi:GTPase SAR1 family protein
MQTFIFKNSGGIERNEVKFTGPPFLLDESEYTFTISPKSSFWRFAIRLSKTENIDFPEGPRHAPGSSDTIDIQLAVGQLIDAKKKEWRGTNIIELGQYNIKGQDHVLNKQNNYREFSEVSLKIENERSGIITVQYQFEDFEFKKELLLPGYKCFQIFAWADWIDFELYCAIERVSTDIVKPRLVFIGNPGVGKTSLINKVFEDASSKKTEVLGDILIKELRLNTFTKTNVEVWEFDKTEISSSLNRVFFNERNIYVVVINASLGLYNNLLEDYLIQIKKYANEALTIVVVNRSNSTHTHQYLNLLIKKFPFVTRIINTVILDGIGISEVKKAIHTLIERKSIFGSEIPQSWRQVIKQLNKLKSAYIDWLQYSSICAKEGIDIGQSKALAELLHDTGNFFFHDSDFYNLRVIFLDLKWMFAGLNMIITSAAEANENGILKKGRINFTKHRYDNNIIDVLLEVLGKFDLCLPDAKRTFYLIPSLLPKQTFYPKEDFEMSRCLNYYFEYEILPESLFFKLLVNIYRLEHKCKCWVDGIILELGANQALIKLNSGASRIEIYINGSALGRKILFTKIKSEVNEINKIYNLTSDERVPIVEHPDVSIPYADLLIMRENLVNILPVVVAGATINVDIRDLTKGLGKDLFEPINIVILFSSADRDRFRHFFNSLGDLQRKKKIVLWWADESIDSVDKEFYNQIKDAYLILALFSSNSINKRFFNKYLNLCLDLHKAKTTKVIPIIVDSVDWKKTPVGQLPAFPRSGQSITLSKYPQEEWNSIISQIENIILETGADLKESKNLVISGIHLINIRCFAEIQLNLLDDENNVGMFGLIVGENGLGKSTILKAIAIGAASEVEAAALISRIQGDMLRSGETSGQITIEFVNTQNGQKYEIKTSLKKVANGDTLISKEFSLDFPSGQLFVCGYGAGRAGFGTENFEGYTISNSTSTLFNYDARLQNPELALRRIESQGTRIEEILQKFDKLLMLEPGSTIIDSTGLKIQGPWGKFLPVGSLGDGYKATLGWISDLFGWGMLFNESMLYGEISGIVLIDELEQHLHPRWQRVIVRDIKQQFPGIQFIVTTHTPFLASGAADFENSKIYSLEWQNDNIVSAKMILKSLLEGKNINKVSSEAFGMLTTLSLGSAYNLEKFAELSSKKELDESEKIEFDSLAKKLKIEDDRLLGL